MSTFEPPTGLNDNSTIVYIDQSFDIVIVSHKYKFIYVAIPKTATHAIRFALRRHLGSDDWEQVDLFHQSRLPYKEFQDITHGHITSSEAKRVLSEEVWDSYFKFTFVRNPFDRFISYAFFRHRSSEIFANNKLGIMKLLFKNPSLGDDILFKPQWNFVTNEFGENIVDFIGRFESLQSDFDAVCQKVGLPQIKLELHNSSEHNNYEHYLDEELIGLISSYYKEDLECFDYHL
ncbi:sulfotransferase family 2 domain-containing protein [Acidiluteibacter ferrifornacis]|uniref:Sulfotransferase family 2 domain-containing protein n=1 Tax=Acidiluteibacter ferrifornacis TaxID=2692424 RepID=A0A6N9NJV6_9FLAO|nr:sulfotransferase family 2 domain-containing protein [Acidiluteibacter ferrifornacis]NBG66139.1 sulfotransferase family 2 domain-containing protein [Acidiluteibacter ferrifornacis]